ncbi:phenolic glucoside malonyltransferase 1-like [Vigna unguiculata]|uniref:phenolic glucoside malonyltransferase 1-like n=1 Tax=Vigna unguiculata TaxID=3917 RepID=UPI001016C5F8|nr:phenolic glucoside malonyltransferase 1-like [Vigna unguiculata]
MKVVEVESIAPSSESKELPTEASFALTFFDILWLRLPPVQRVFFYEFHHPSDVFFDTLLPKLKRSLSLALGHFYPLAGHLTWPTHSTKPLIVYNQGDTLSLTVAESDADFNHLAGTNFTEATETHPFVPPLTISHEQTTLFAVQVTLFPNAGFAIGITSHHAVLDGKASTTFVKSWAYLCREAQPPYSLPAEWVPFFDREIVKDPTKIGEKYSRDWLKMGGPNNRSLKVSEMPVPEEATRGLFHLSSSGIEKLKQIVQSKENNTNLHLSTFVLAAAYSMVCRVKAEGGQSTSTGFGLNVDCRRQMEPPVPPTYLGNCVGITVAITETKDLLGEDGLVVAVKALSEALGTLKKEGFLHEAEDWWKMVYESYKVGDTKTAAFAGSPRFDIYSSDFGWGKPTKVEMVSIDRTAAFCFSDSRTGDGIEIGFVTKKKAMETFASLFEEGLRS